MESVAELIKINAGGFVTGVIVAILQLVLVYVWIEKRVEKIQLKSEARKWRDARKELDASLLSLAHTLVRPLDYYSIEDEDGIYFRENFSMCMQHVIDKNQTLDSMLAIYSVGLAPESFTNINQIADRLRSAAGDASSAVKNWEKIADTLPHVSASTGKIIQGIRRASKSIEFEVPKDPTERHEKLFAYYTLQTFHQISWVAEQLIEVSQAQYSMEQLDNTSRYIRLRELSREEQTVQRDMARATESIRRLRALVSIIEQKGIKLSVTSEVD